jgi:hypothetical protein
VARPAPRISRPRRGRRRWACRARNASHSRALR